MALKTSIARYVSSKAAADCLEIPYDRSWSPVTTVCPLCGANNRLSLLNEDPVGGGWYRCMACGSSGDMIELVAAAWQVDYFSAVTELHRMGIAIPQHAITPEAVQEYETVHVGRRQRMRQFCDTAGNRLEWNANMLGNLLEKLGLRNSWGQLRRMAPFIGAASFVDAAQAFQPHVQSRRGATTGSCRLFEGRGWDDVLTVPFEDLPGRICGVLFIGRNGNAGDCLYRPFTLGHATPWVNQPRPLESGLCMASALYGRTYHPELFESYSFVFTSPIQAIALQSRHLSDHELPLPLSGSYNGYLLPTRHGYRHRLAPVRFWEWTGRRMIFCGTRATAALFEMAYRTEGRVFAGPPEPEWNKFTPIAQLWNMQQRSKPWREALEEAIQQLEGAELSQLLDELAIPNHSLKEIIRDFSPSTKRVLMQHPRFAEILQTHYAERGEVVERADGWYLKDGRLVSDAILRIDRIHVRAGDNKAFYQGSILHHGDRLPFVAPERVVEKGPLRWMQRQLQAAGKEMQYRKRWSSEALPIAMDFHRPEVFCDSGRFGWHPCKSVLVLPKFIARPGHGVSADSFPAWDTLSPAQNLSAPGELKPETLRALTADNLSNRVFWATAACLLANIVGPVRNQRPLGIGLIGPGSQAIGRQTAEALGCASFQVPGLPTSPVDLSGAVEAAVNRHNWPLVLRLPRGVRSRDLSLWSMTTMNKNVVLEMEEPQQTAAMGITGCWRMVRCDLPLPPSDIIREYGPLILPHWLQDIARRRFALASRRGPFSRQIAEDLAAWVGERGDAQVVRSAAGMVEDTGHGWPPGVSGGAQWLVRLLHGLIRDGYLGLEEGRELTLFAHFNLHRLAGANGSGGVFMAKQLAAELLQSPIRPLLDLPYHMAEFAKAGVVQTMDEYLGMPGWLIPENLWQRQIVCYNKLERYQRRLCRMWSGQTGCAPGGLLLESID